jgi:hypothetical protein
MTTQWIGQPGEEYTVGQVGFLIRNYHVTKGWERVYLTGYPAHTNASCEPRLSGWCGTTNDVSYTAMGLARVEHVAQNGRARIRLLTGDELSHTLMTLGFPHLA